MGRADQLAAEFERRVVEFSDYVAGLNAEQWRTKCGNHPELHSGEDEHRSVGVVAHHVTDWFDWQRQTIVANAAGRDGPRPSGGDANQTNAAHEAANPDPDQKETVKLIRTASRPLADAIRGLSDAELDRTRSSTIVPTVVDFIQRVVTGHVEGHLASVKATLES